MRLAILHTVAIGLIALLTGCQLAGEAGDRPPLERLRLADGFAIELFAEIPGARSLAVADDGARIYVGTRGHEVFAVLDPERDGKANEVIRVASGLKVPNGLAVDRDGTLYVAEQHRILRLPPSDKPEVPGEWKVIVPPGVLPDQSLHGVRYAGFGPDGRLYVALGAPCNACETKGFEGTMIRLRPDGHALEIYAHGLRNAQGLDWHPGTGELFFTDDGTDWLGDLIPPDELNHAPEPYLHFGYPYRYGMNLPNPRFVARTPHQATTGSVLDFQAHAAALALRFYRGAMFPEAYRHDAFVAQHGSWNRTDPVGYRVMRVHFNSAGQPISTEVFVDGWLDRDDGFWGRPVDIAELPDGSLLVSDDFAGLIYRITYVGR